MSGLPIIENGPWSAEEWSDGAVVVQSDDFHHDVALIVTGDFFSKATKLRYAEEIARRLNEYRKGSGA